MLCPRCRLINPDSALLCDCGYDFIAGVARPGPTVVSVSAALRWVVAALIANAVLGVTAQMLSPSVGLAKDAGGAWWVVLAIAQLAGVVTIAMLYKLAVAIGESRAWLYVVASFVPVACTIALVVLMSRTWAWLRAHGGYRMRA